MDIINDLVALAVPYYYNNKHYNIHLIFINDLVALAVAYYYNNI